VGNAILRPAAGRTFTDDGDGFVTRDATPDRRERAVTKRAVTKPSDGETPTPEPIDSMGTGHNFKSIAERDAFIEAEFTARREIMRRITAPPAVSAHLVAQHRAERMLELEWRSLQAESCGEELRAWDRAERAANEHIEMVEGLDARTHQDALDETLAGWIVGGRNLLDRKDR
jgi:hypothetical protein